MQSSEFPCHMLEKGMGLILAYNASSVTCITLTYGEIKMQYFITF